MALEKDVNSFATVEEADVYFENRIDVAAWDEAEEDQKARALVTATSLLNELEWSGVAVSETQTLAFPRKEVSYLDPLLGKYVTLDPDTVPRRIIQGALELAYHLLNNDGLLDSSGSVKSITVGPIQLDTILAASVIPAHVLRTIRPLMQSRGSLSSHPWWRAN
jgi:hypothetical protein